MTKPKIAKKSSGSAKHKIDTGKGGGAVAKIINTVAKLKLTRGMESVERGKLSFYTGIKGKSTIANALTKIKENKWMDVTPQDVTITDLGMENADTDSIESDMPTCNKDYHDSMKEQHKLTAKMSELFDALADGRTYNKQEMAKQLGMKMNSTWANMLTKMKKLEFIEFDRKTIHLTDLMFPVEARASD